MLTQEEQIRYARQLIMPHIGEEGQKKLKQSHILVAGVGGGGQFVINLFNIFRDRAS